MGMRKADSVVPAAVLEAAKAAVEAAPTPRVIDTPKPERKRDAVVIGQVRMHAIKTGYDVAGQLAATIAAGPDTVKTVLHTLAEEVAAAIEAYTFKGE